MRYCLKIRTRISLKTAFLIVWRWNTFEFSGVEMEYRAHNIFDFKSLDYSIKIELAFP